MSKQIEVLRSIQSFMDEHGHAPTYRDIQARMGLSSTSVAFYWVSKLIGEGLLTVCDKCDDESSRSLKITAYGTAMLKVAV